MLVLVADAEQEYGEVIGELLRRQSHRVVLAASLDSFRRFLDRSTADLIIMSTSMAGEAPEELIREIRRVESTPIIALFDRAPAAQVARCFDAGADDCVRKPFHPSEFAARVEAVARRCVASRTFLGEGAPVTTLRAVGPTLLGEGLEFDHTANRVYFNGSDLNCSQLEYQILNAMAAADGQVLSYSYLNERVWGYPNLSDGTLLKGHISSIRSKLRAAGHEDQLIRTIYGVGYALSATAVDSLSAEMRTA